MKKKFDFFVFCFFFCLEFQDFIAERENGMKKFWIKNVSNPREVTGVYKPLFKIPQVMRKTQVHKEIFKANWSML